VNEHPNAVVARRGFETFVAGDAQSLLRMFAREGGRLDIEQILLIRLEAGAWADVQAQPLDQAAFDACWA
jgi:hypothetical protein